MKRGTASRVFFGVDKTNEDFGGLLLLSQVTLGKKSGMFDEHKGLCIVDNVLLGKGIARVISVIIRGTSPLSLPDAVAGSLSYVKAFGGTEQRNLPSEYTELEYIEGTGTQYIDTGYVPNVNTETKINFLTTTLPSSDAYMFHSSDGGDARISLAIKQHLIFFGDDLTKTTNRITLPEFTANTAYDITVNKDKAIVNGTEYNFTHTSVTLPTMGSMGLFGSRRGTLICQGRVKSFSCNENNVLKINLIPARRNSDNVLGMYDTVSGTFFTNVGTGDFVAGPDAVPTPDAPMDIVTNNGVLKASRNLWPAETEKTVQGVSLTNQPDGSIKIHGTAIESDHFTITSNILAGTYTLAAYDVTATAATGTQLELYVPSQNKVVTVAFSEKASVISKNITLNSDAQVQFRLRINKHVTYNNYIIKPMLVQGTTLPTNWHPYGEIYTDGTVETIEDTIGNTATAEMLLKVGNYQDVQSILDGVVTRNVGAKVLDGTEDWNTNAFTDVFSLQDSSWIPSDGSPLYCSHFNNIVLPITAQREGNSWFNLGRFNIGWASMVAQGTTAFKQWLADQYANGTPVMIVYPLATETTESVAGQTLQVQAGDNVLEITQASLTGLELEAQYQKRT